jgi:hypothetical protein
MFHERIPARRAAGLRRAAAASAVLALLGLAGACATSPPHIVSVPGTYEVDLSAPTLEYPQGGAPVAKVVMCVGSPTAVAMSADAPLDSATVEWASGTFDFPTPVLQPGCGQLRLVVECCVIPPTVRITLSEV